MQTAESEASLDPQPYRAALRSRLVARLSGVSLRQLWLWHNRGLIRTDVLPGGPGRPRLYSWVDYLKVRAARHLRDEGVSAQRTREAIAYLDEHVPAWYLLPLHGFAGEPVVGRRGITAKATPVAQLLFDWSTLEGVLRTLQAEGPLGELREFSECVAMDPSIVGGNPVIRGTRLETQFIAALVERGLPVTEIAETYHLSPKQVEQALEFQRAAA
jgi:uncharacterized protein (DUF433 family)/DNA-binding transcriptional MerR regulator